MALNLGPRLAMAIMIGNYYKTLGKPTMKRRALYEMLANLSSLLHFIENIGLIGLSLVSITDNLCEYGPGYSGITISIS